MKKKKDLPAEDNMNAMEDTKIFGAGHEADETLNTDEDIEIHTNGGIPDGTGDDEDDEEDDDTDDNRA
jgi:hypothetical protein